MFIFSHFTCFIFHQQSVIILTAFNSNQPVRLNLDCLSHNDWQAHYLWWKNIWKKNISLFWAIKTTYWYCTRLFLLNGINEIFFFFIYFFKSSSPHKENLELFKFHFNLMMNILRLIFFSVFFCCSLFSSLIFCLLIDAADLFSGFFCFS